MVLAGGACCFFHRGLYADTDYGRVIMAGRNTAEMEAAEKMSTSVMRCFEYTITCDRCEAQEVYHTGDEDRGCFIHSLRDAVKASGYRMSKKRNGTLLCPDCWRDEI